MRSLCVIVFTCLFVLSSKGFGQDPSPIVVVGRVVDAITNQPVVNAQVVSYGLVAVFATDTAGYFRIELSPQDSIRATAIGYYSKNLKVSDQVHPTDTCIMRLEPVSYVLKEVRVMGYRGVLDPLIFPKFESTKPTINLNLPSWIGSSITKLPPSERSLMPSPSIAQAVFSPLSFAYSKFSRRERSLRLLQKIKVEQSERSTWIEVLADSSLSRWIPLEGVELNRFIAYCNTHLTFSKRDTKLGIQHKVMALWAKYGQKEEE